MEFSKLSNSYANSKAHNYTYREYDYSELEKILLGETKKNIKAGENPVLSEEDQKAGYCLDKDVADALGLKWIGDKS